MLYNNADVILKLPINNLDNRTKSR